MFFGILRLEIEGVTSKFDIWTYLLEPRDNF